MKVLWEVELLARNKLAHSQRRLAVWMSKADVMSTIAGIGILIAAGIAFVRMPADSHHFRGISADGLYRQAFLRLYAILFGVFCSVFLLAPMLQTAVQRLRLKWRNSFTWLTLIALCGFIWIFLVHCGRHQYGAFDLNILVELGWRQILGQRPYVDFPDTTSPGFNFGCKYAFQLFGVRWDANLYLAALYSCATFLWMYWLMRRISAGRLASAAVAFAVESASMLALCFWWYNDITLVAAAIFFLACIAYARQPHGLGVQLSYIFSLSLLSLMKPNMAGLTILCCVPLLLLLTTRKLRLLTLTAAATITALLILASNHVPVPAMVTSYLSVAKAHGSTHSAFGFNLLNRLEQHWSLYWIGFLSIPLLGLFPKGYRLLRTRDWRGIGLALMMPVSCFIAWYGLLVNSEFRDTECTLLLVAIGVLAFGVRWNGPFLRRFTIAVLCASIAGDLYYGVARLRIYPIGPGVFFQWRDNQHRMDSGFFKNMRVAEGMVQVQQDVSDVLKHNPGPYFFGTRLDYNYAAFGVPSPEHFPAWWQPGTAFPVSAESSLIDRWKQDRFQTLVFLKHGFAGNDDTMFYTFYPPEWMDAIRNNYVADNETYPTLTVYHRR